MFGFSHRSTRPRRTLTPFATTALSLAVVALSAGSWPRDAGALAPPKPAADTSSAAKSASPTRAELKQRLANLLAADFLKDAKVSVDVVDLATGRSVYALNRDLPLNPASNVKLVTTAAALTRLGPEHRFSTRLYVDADSRRGQEIHGDLYLKGSGDPSLTTGELYELAARVRARGIKTIRGRIVVDASRFDRDGLPPGFDQKDEFAAYRAPTGAASVNFNTYELRASPAATAGQAAHLAIVPRVASVTVENHATTVAGRRNRLQVAVEEEEGKNTRVIVRGTIGADASSASYRYPVKDPSRYAGEVLRRVLRENGVRVSRAGTRSAELPRDARLIATHRSEPVSVLIRAINKLSNNFMAEQLLRTLAPGEGASAEASLTALNAYAKTIGLPAAGLKLGNGSGLYDNNRLTSAQLTHLLRTMYGDFRYRSDYLSSLAVMGTEGTLRRRLRETPAQRWVRGKTGTLDGVSVLSGYAGAPGRHPFAFSILMNDLGRWERGAARRVQNEIADALARDVAGPPCGDTAKSAP